MELGAKCMITNQLVLGLYLIGIGILLLSVSNLIYLVAHNNRDAILAYGNKLNVGFVSKAIDLYYKRANIILWFTVLGTLFFSTAMVYVVSDYLSDPLPEPVILIDDNGKPLSI